MITHRVHRDLARAISNVENGVAPFGEALEAFTAAGHPNGVPRHSAVLGVTGPPGAGKSTLTDRIIVGLREQGLTVAVVAVDPSSPFTHGAVLGDRVRMQRHTGDPGVYIRSMASRHAAGGLAPATRDAIALCEAAGFDIVIVETVGVGQVELEVVGVADLIVVVTVPALGDAVQTIKAGLTEIADVFVVNMADRPGANATALDLRHMVREGGRDIPIFQTIASDGTGVPELVTVLRERLAAGESNAVRAARFEIVRRVRDRAVAHALAALERPDARAVFERVRARELTRTDAIDSLLTLIGEPVHAD